MDSTNLAQLLKHFYDKIDMIWYMMPLARLCKHMDDDSTVKSGVLTKFVKMNDTENDDTDSIALKMPDWNALSEMTVEMRVMVMDMRNELIKQKQNLGLQKERCHVKLDMILQHSKYLKDNVPSFMSNYDRYGIKNPSKDVSQSLTNLPSQMREKMHVKDNTNDLTNEIYQKNQKADVTYNRQQQTKVAPKNVKKRAKDVYLNPPVVTFITVQEYESIPNYIRGRIVYDDMNCAIGDFNNTITEKYKLMANESSKYTDDEMTRYSVWKGQENGETNGQFFCVEEDLRRYSKLKIENIRKILICLRHCKRINEIRGPQKIVRFAVRTK